jgi:DNA polymerase
VRFPLLPRPRLPSRGPRCYLDLETYSECELTKCGAWRYGEDFSTEFLCAAVAIDGAEPRLWLPGDPVPPEILEAETIHAWNAEFEIALWLGVGRRRYGWPEPDLKKIRCSKSIALSFNLPAKLGKCAAALGIAQQKDDRGRYLIQKLCKPRSRVSKENPEPRWTPATAPDDFDEFYRYCLQDVRAERGVEDALPRRDLPDIEQRFYYEMLLANMRGAQIDLPGVALAVAGVEKYTEKLEAQFAELTGGVGPRQLEPVRDWLADNGLELPNLQSETIRDALEDLEMSDDVRRALQLRQAIGQVAVKKLYAMQRSVCRDGRIRGMLEYHTAGTGRAGAKLVQLQNLKRPDEKTGVKTKLHEWVDSPAAFDPEVLEELGDPMNFFGAFVRPLIMAAPKKVLLVADFNAVECRFLAWLAGEQWLLDLFAEGGDPYLPVASELFGRAITKADDTERQIGKRVELGCGYQMGGPKFHTTCRKYGVKLNGERVSIDFCERAVDVYRGTHPNVKSLWYEVQDAAHEAVARPGLVTTARRLQFYSMGGRWLQMRLPSSRLLSYCRPKLARGTIGRWELTYEGVNSYTKQWARLKTYGGHLVENATQGGARDLLRDALIRLADHGYTGLWSAHDEAISEILWINADHEGYCKLMAEVPAWADGLPIHVEGWSGPRYHK